MAWIALATAVLVVQTSDGPNNSPDEIGTAARMERDHGGSWECTRFDHAAAFDGRTSTTVCVRTDGLQEVAPTNN